MKTRVPLSFAGCSRKRFLLLSWVLVTALTSAAQAPALPPVLTFANGARVKTAADWKKRRAEILDFYTSEVFGKSPGRPEGMSFKLVEENRHALGGKATRKQVDISFTQLPGISKLHLLIYLPNGIKKAPLITGINFYGNETVIADSAVLIDTNWVDTRQKGMVNFHATAASRGGNSAQWAIGKMISRGYGFATFYAGDLDPDYYDNFRNGIHALYPGLQGIGNNFSAMGAWAWGLSRAMDYFETDPRINAKQVAVFGHSRFGKAALWAGAADQRFALVISNESGKGGASLFSNNKGEALAHLTTGFKHWYCTNFKKYNGLETSLPFDQHWLLSLIAPRPLYVASAADDKNSDPEGEFLSAKACSPVYQLLGKKGLPATAMPGLNQPSMGRVAYHIRNGGHNVMEYDWEQYLNFADRFFKK